MSSTAKGINEATESFVEVPSKSDKVQLWFRVWGDEATGIPVLFVHGGPGACVDDYKNINAKFFDKEKFYVIEVDQRGTGASLPSVRDGVKNVQTYLDISIEQMSADFEIVRNHLGISRWLVFGGSWGSTLGLDYAERFPAVCLGLIHRGIYLNTEAEFDAIYARKSFLNNERRLKEFDIFFELAAAEVQKQGEKELSPNDSERFIRTYEKMIVNGDRDAAWRFYVFENNLMEEDPADLLDPYQIDEEIFPEALSTAFFEARLFLRGTFEEPLNLLGKVSALKDGYGDKPVKTWVVQGEGDEVCPEIYAQQLKKRLEAVGPPGSCLVNAYFVDAGHKASSNGITIALQKCVQEFLDQASEGQ